MKIIDESTLDLFRTPGPCEICKAHCNRREPHHVFCKGVGSGGRLDIRLNLIAVGGAGGCNCHGQIHSARGPKRHELVALVARRERVTPDQVLDTVYRLLRTRKESADVGTKTP